MVLERLVQLAETEILQILAQPVILDLLLDQPDQKEYREQRLESELPAILDVPVEDIRLMKQCFMI